MVETDYPHFDSTWPESQAMIRRECSHLPAATVQKVCFGTGRVYRHPLPPADMIARSRSGSGRRAIRASTCGPAPLHPHRSLRSESVTR